MAPFSDSNDVKAGFGISTLIDANSRRRQKRAKSFPAHPQHLDRMVGRSFVTGGIDDPFRSAARRTPIWAKQITSAGFGRRSTPAPARSMRQTSRTISHSCSRSPSICSRATLLRALSTARTRRDFEVVVAAEKDGPQTKMVIPDISGELWRTR